jgi:hypothetical protein
MLLHIDGSEHAWFQDERRYDLLTVLDDATSQSYYAQPVHQLLVEGSNIGIVLGSD